MTGPQLAFRLRRRVVLEHDLRRMRSRHEAAFAGEETAPDAPVALFVSLTEFVYQLKLEAVLGRALQLEGMRPVVLVPGGSWIPRRYLHTFGIRDLEVLEDRLDAAARREARAEADRVLAQPLSAAGLKALEFRGAAIGRHVLSTLSRSLRSGAVDLADPAVRARLAQLLPRTLEATLAAERLLDELRPRLVLFLERNYASEAPVSELAVQREIDVIQFIAGGRDDELVFKRYTRETRRVHPRSLSEESWRRVREQEWTDRHERELDADLAARYGSEFALARRLHGHTRERSREEVLTALRLDPEKPTAVVYSHILWDANMFYGEDLFADQEEWFAATVRAACANDAVNWIVKLHPANVWKLAREGARGELNEEAAIRRSVGALPGHVALLAPDSEVSTRSVFALTDWGVTIRGSVGFELPCFGVPVLTAGTGFYAGRGFTVDSATAEEYLARLAAIQTIPRLSAEQVELARRHAYGVLHLRPLRFASLRATVRERAGSWHPLDHDVEIAIRTREQLERADDLRRFAAWAAGGRELDYLQPDPG